jgi:hypothetical protein
MNQKNLCDNSRQYVRQCAAVHVVVCGSVRDSVRLCGSAAAVCAAVCGSVRGSVQQCVAVQYVCSM